MELSKMLEDYLKTLTPLELKGYHIAKDHLGCTFDLKKSLGFIAYKKKIEESTSSKVDTK
tara:strand:- start:307 stop:486 length:180 start_codon:yes stop_codon:yes gene_type:complete